MFGHPFGKFMIGCMITSADDLSGDELVRQAIRIYKNIMSEF